MHSLWHSLLSMRSAKTSVFWNILFTRVFILTNIDLKWSLTFKWTAHTYYMRSVLNSFFRYCIVIFWFLYLDLKWPPPSHIFCILHYSDFCILTCNIIKWPLTSSVSNRLVIVNVVHLYTTYDINHCFPSGDVVFTMFV